MAEEWYTVESGDTLFSIAWRSRLRVADLAAWNKLGDGSLILVGQRLRLTPPPGYAVAEQGGSAAGSATAGAVASPAPGAAAGGVGQAKPVASAAGSGAKAAVGGRSAPARAGPAASRPASSAGVAAGKGKWRWPTQGSVDAKSARVRAGDFGIRIMGERGQEIVAADSGKVMYAGDGLKAYGLLVIVQHTPQWLSAYGHNEKILVKEGDEVPAGQPIATMGVGSGNAAMLHFEIRQNGKPVEPIGLLPPRN